VAIKTSQFGFKALISDFLIIIQSLVEVTPEKCKTLQLYTIAVFMIAYSIKIFA